MGDGDFGDSRDFKWNNYISRYHQRHCDLMDLLALYQPRANVPLDDMAKLCGFPGKLGMDGSKVWEAFHAGRLKEIRNYCETDAVNTYLMYLRFCLVSGRFDADEYEMEIKRIRNYLRPNRRQTALGRICPSVEIETCCPKAVRLCRRFGFRRRMVD